MKLLGRLASINDGKAQFSGALRNLCEMSDLKMNRLLDTIDEWVTENPLGEEVPPPHRFEPTRVVASPPLGMNLNSGRSRPLSGQRGSGLTIAGSTCRSSIAKAASDTTVAWSRPPACT